MSKRTTNSRAHYSPSHNYTHINTILYASSNDFSFNQLIVLIKLNWEHSWFRSIQSTSEFFDPMQFRHTKSGKRQEKKNNHRINCIYRAPVFTGLTVIITLGMQFSMQLQWIYAMVAKYTKKCFSVYRWKWVSSKRAIPKSSQKFTHIHTHTHMETHIFEGICKWECSLMKLIRSRYSYCSWIFIL